MLAETTVTLNPVAIRVLDLHRIAEIDQRIAAKALQHMKIERELIQLAKEREALRVLVSS